MNQVSISGKVINDFQLNETKTKKIPVINFRIQHKNNKTKTPVYIDVEAWGDTAKEFSDNAKRGSIVTVHAELRRDVWLNSDKEERSKLKLTADKIIIESTEKNSV